MQGRLLDVGIIGGGTAGSAAAILLARAGHRITVYERVPDPRPVGAGIVIQPTGMVALSRLGLLERVAARGARLDRLRVNTARGRTIVDLRYHEVAPDLFGLGLHRGALFEALLAGVRAESVTLRLGVAVTALRREGAQRLCLNERGEALGAHDLVIVADGARSQLRDGAGIRARTADYRWGALWFVAQDPDGDFTGQLEQTVDGTHTMLGMLPTGLGPGEGQTKVVSLFWSVREDRVAALRTTGFAAWKERVRSLEPRTEPVLAQIPDGQALLFSAYKRVEMPAWHGDGIVFLGDAAHAMSPQLGQGANLALYDAMVLADCLAAEGGDPSRALPRYTRERRSHLGFYALATYWLTPLFQSDYALLGPLRDIGMSLMTWLRPLRLEMTRSMCGLKRRILGGSLPPPSLPRALPGVAHRLSGA